MVLTGGNSGDVVAPGAPIEPSAVGENGSESQPVGVILNSLGEHRGASQEFARLSEVPSAHDVGIRMNGSCSPLR